MMTRFLSHWRKPQGPFGRLVAWILNFSHARGAVWGLQHITIAPHLTMLDIGCGGGWVVHRLAACAPHGRVYGIDFSLESVAVARRANRQWIAQGRAAVFPAAASNLPFKNNAFDLVSAVNSHYYWPDLAHDLGEALRVIKPGGKLILIGEGYKGGKYAQRMQKWQEWTKATNLSMGETREILTAVGFSGVQVFDQYDKGWICATGVKPAGNS